METGWGVNLTTLQVVQWLFSFGLRKIMPSEVERISEEAAIKYFKIL
jgi:hypothetical protein